MLTIGIDVGITGAVAAVDASGFAGVYDLPVITNGKTKWVDGPELAAIIRGFVDQQRQLARPGVDLQLVRLVIERTHAMPKNGAIAGFSQGLTLGSVLSALQFTYLPIEFVEPNSWKARLGLRRPGMKDNERKRASLDLARLWFPTAELDRQKDHNRAEALLIAAYWRRYVWQGSAAA